MIKYVRSTTISLGLSFPSTLYEAQLPLNKCVNKFLSVPIKLPETEATHCPSNSFTFSLISPYTSYFCSSVKGHEFKTCEKNWTAICVKFDVNLVYCYQKSKYPIHSQKNLLSNQSRPIECSTTYLYLFQ